MRAARSSAKKAEIFSTVGSPPLSSPKISAALVSSIRSFISRSNSTTGSSVSGVAASGSTRPRSPGRHAKPMPVDTRPLEPWRPGLEERAPRARCAVRNLLSATRPPCNAGIGSACRSVRRSAATGSLLVHQRDKAPMRRRHIGACRKDLPRSTLFEGTGSAASRQCKVGICMPFGPAEPGRHPRPPTRRSAARARARCAGRRARRGCSAQRPSTCHGWLLRGCRGDNPSPVRRRARQPLSSRSADRPRRRRALPSSTKERENCSR